ncbi:AAA domain-containing protein [Aminipila butyrica]|uniref:HTH-type transcriptional regulatory protein TyrR n=1 Tax=Aminipila butyrica TaxID=433296 RepID=A0A858BZG4_9FIRM|nr:sigma 54-interacting transcriptional regulator [Aminipila butyrica]QIB70535.1 AAA domain-containing protein [Aminipila butyrica]
METTKDIFGLSRVIEPKTAVPVTAWRVDNHRDISSTECRITLERIHLERDCFQQLCSECSFDEEKIIAKILELISRRGKLHNPFTNTAGQFYGIIEEMGSGFARHSGYKIGQPVFCLTTMTAHPVFIQKIHKIDYNYGELTVTGYAIAFQGSPMTTIPESLQLNYTMATFDEAASLYSIYTIAKKGKRYLIVGKDLVSSITYVSAIRQAVGTDGYMTVILDEAGVGTLTPQQVKQELSRWTNTAYILNVDQPVQCADEVLEKEEQPYDVTINCEDVMGSEVLSVLLTRNKGQLYFTSIKNSYTQSILIAESMSKELDTYLLGQFILGYENYTLSLLLSISKDLDRINQLYDTQAISFRQAAKQAHAADLEKSGRIGDFVFSSPETKALVDEALNIAQYDCNIILQGETGVGKEKILDLIHKNSIRKNKPCIKINCATIQENLAESEFFGYEAGAFTGAQAHGKKGYFELANGGILFLDEVGTLSLNLQSKLLRVLQESQFYKVGGTTSVHINVRVICANNIPLRQLVEQGAFREDLYYRLNICTITVPPLRERREDIAALSISFLKSYCQQYNLDRELDVTALAALTGYSWPGNVRELENFIHRAVISVREHVITGEDIQEVLHENLYADLVIDLKRSVKYSASLNFEKIVEQQERQLIEYALKKFGTTRKAAEFLQISQPKLMRKKQKYGIETP